MSSESSFCNFFRAMISYEQRICELVKIKTYLTREIRTPGSAITIKSNAMVAFSAMSAMNWRAQQSWFGFIQYIRIERAFMILFVEHWPK